MGTWEGGGGGPTSGACRFAYPGISCSRSQSNPSHSGRFQTRTCPARCQPMPTDVNRCQPMSTDVNRCQPMSTDVNRCQPMLTDGNRC
eukprot:1192533-Prorocentrum_minimum.AAC.1